MRHERWEGAAGGAILRTPLGARGGLAVLSGLLSEPDFTILRSEALAMERGAQRSVSAGDGEESWRGGNPARAYRGARGGQVQYGFFSNPLLAGFLSDMVGFRVELSGAGSYSYYDAQGDFLALHRDVLQCDVAVLTCLENSDAAEGGCLRTYPDFMGEPLASIRCHPSPPRVDAVFGPGETAVLLGGCVPHEVTPMAPGQRRVVSILCFRALE
jgi:hypothetical protein